MVVDCWFAPIHGCRFPFREHVDCRLTKYWLTNLLFVISPSYTKTNLLVHLYIISLQIVSFHLTNLSIVVFHPLLSTLTFATIYQRHGRLSFCTHSLTHYGILSISIYIIYIVCLYILLNKVVVYHSPCHDKDYLACPFVQFVSLQIVESFNELINSWFPPFVEAFTSCHFATIY